MDSCICCGEYVPEGRMVCPGCERFGDPVHVKDKKTAILENLKKYHTGKKNAVHSAELERLFLWTIEPSAERSVTFARKAGPSAAEKWATLCRKPEGDQFHHRQAQ